MSPAFVMRINWVRCMRWKLRKLWLLIASDAGLSGVNSALFTQSKQNPNFPFASASHFHDNPITDQIRSICIALAWKIFRSLSRWLRAWPSRKKFSRLLHVEEAIKVQTPSTKILTKFHWQSSAGFSRSWFNVIDKRTHRKSQKWYFDLRLRP